MSHTLTAPQRGRKTATAVYNESVSFDKAMEAGLSLTGTPTVTVETVTVPPLTATNPTVTAAAKTIAGKSIPAGRAVTFACAGGLAGNTYRLKISCANNATPAETPEGYILIDVAAD